MWSSHFIITSNHLELIYYYFFKNLRLKTFTAQYVFGIFGFELEFTVQRPPSNYNRAEHCLNWAIERDALKNAMRPNE